MLGQRQCCCALHLQVAHADGHYCTRPTPVWRKLPTYLDAEVFQLCLVGDPCGTRCCACQRRGHKLPRPQSVAYLPPAAIIR